MISTHIIRCKHSTQVRKKERKSKTKEKEREQMQMDQLTDQLDMLTCGSATNRSRRFALGCDLRRKVNQ